MNFLLIPFSSNAVCGCALKKSLFLLLVFVTVGIRSGAQYFQWAGSDGITTGVGEAQGYCISTDGYGNVYTTGYFQGTVDFDPGPGIFTLTSPLEQVYIQKSDKSGNLIWAKQLAGAGSGGSAIARSIVADSVGNIYFTGIFEYSVNFDPGAGTYVLTSAGSYDIFVEKLDSGGNFIWAKQIGGISDDEGESIVIDQFENVYLTGFFSSTVDFDPGPGVYDLSCIGYSANAFAEKLDSSGNFVWAKEVGTATSSFGGCAGMSIALDDSGNIYTTGSFTDTCDFDPGSGTFYLSTVTESEPNAYVSKLDDSGNLIWVKQIGGIGDCYGYAIQADPSGNAILVGSFNYTVDLDPGPGVYDITDMSALGNNGFIEKLSASGDFLWGSLLGTTGDMAAISLCVDKSGNSYNTGFFQNTVDFDPGPGVYDLSATGSDEATYVQKLDSNGNFVWAVEMAGTNAIQGDGITIDPQRNIYLTGFFSGTYDFDPGPGVFSITSSGGDGDLFTEKLYQYKYGSGTATACGSYTLDGATLTSSGTLYDTLTAALGMDSILNISVTINALPLNGPVTGIDSVCDGAIVTLNDSIAGGLWNASNAHAIVSGNTVSGVSAGIDTIFYVTVNAACNDTVFFPITVTSCTPTETTNVPGNGIDLSVSPNPGNGVFNISYSSTSNEPAYVCITDMLGKKVMEFTAYANKETTITLDVPPGMYFLNAASGNERFTEKIVVAK